MFKKPVFYFCYPGCEAAEPGDSFAAQLLHSIPNLFSTRTKSIFSALLFPPVDLPYVCACLMQLCLSVQELSAGKGESRVQVSI